MSVEPARFASVYHSPTDAYPQPVSQGKPGDTETLAESTNGDTNHYSPDSHTQPTIQASRVGQMQGEQYSEHEVHNALSNANRHEWEAYAQMRSTRHHS
jgi:hypothetical protein